MELVSNSKNQEYKDRSPDYYYANGMVAKNRKEYDKAVDYFIKALEIDKNYLYAYIDYSQILYETSKYDEEVKLLETANAHIKNDPDINLYLGNAYEDIGKYNLAIKAYENVLMSKPDEKDTLYYLSILYLISNNKEKAQKLIPKLEKVNMGLANEIHLLIKAMK